MYYNINIILILGLYSTCAIVLNFVSIYLHSDYSGTPVTSIFLPRGMASPSRTAKRPRRETLRKNNTVENSGKLLSHAINVDSVRGKLHDPTSWTCHQSNTTDDIWICLGDGVVCAKGSSNTGGPASNHFLESGFALFMRLTETDNHRQLSIEEESRQICYSQAEQRFYAPKMGSPEADKIISLYRTLKLTRYCQSSCVTEDIITRRQRQDRVGSLMFTWRYLIATKAFNSWRMVHGKHRPSATSCQTEKFENANASTAVNKSTVLPASKGSRKEYCDRASQLLGGRTGLRNLGNTCYLNSLFQALAHVPLLKEYYCDEITSILGGKVPEVNKTPSVRLDVADPALLSKQLVVLFRLIHGNGRTSHTPHDLVAAIWHCLPQFRGYRQHDAQELFLAVLNRLREEECYLVAQGQTPTNVVDELFSGETVTEFGYKSRQGSKSNVNPFIGSITIEIPKESHEAIYIASSGSSIRRITKKRRNGAPCSIEKCLTLALKSVDIDGHDEFSSMKLSYSQLPRVLFVHVNRTDWINGMKKIKGYVDFPIRNLNMQGTIANRQQSSMHSSEDNVYDLYSVVVHHGRAMNQGHFTTFALNNGEWYHFNDHMVTRVSEDRVAAQLAYLLVYQRKSRSNITGTGTGS